MEHELVERAREGDREAFASIVDAMLDRSHEVARRILGESHLAQDATQQAMLSIWRDLPKLRDTARFEAWAHRILVRACYAEASRARRSLPDLAAAAGPATVVVSGGFGTIIDRDQLDHAFARQRVEHRAVLVLRYYLDLPLEEIASVLDVPIGTVKSRIHHALRGMRAAIEADSRVPTGGGTVTHELSTSRCGRGWR